MPFKFWNIFTVLGVASVNKKLLQFWGSSCTKIVLNCSLSFCNDYKSFQNGGNSSCPKSSAKFHIHLHTRLFYFMNSLALQFKTPSSFYAWISKKLKLFLTVNRIWTKNDQSVNFVYMFCSHNFAFAEFKFFLLCFKCFV